MRIFTIILCCLTIIITALPILEVAWWWVRIWDYPRLQIASLCLFSAAFLWVYVDKMLVKIIFTILLTAAFVYQMVYIVPYTPLYPLQAQAYEGKKNKSSFTILEANVKMDNREYGKFLSLAAEKNPDIIVITEPDEKWERALNKLEETYPYTIKKPLSNTYGMLLYSRLPLKNQQVNFLVEDNIPSFYARVILPDKQEFDLYALHPKPPQPGTPTYDRDTEVLIVGRKVKAAKQPAILVGDMNDVGWSNTTNLFQRYSRMLDPRIGRGSFNTYSVNFPFFRYPLDHFFYTKHFGFVSLQKLSSIDSDHYPIFLEVNLNSNGHYIDNLPEADKEDKEDVKETITQDKE